MVLFLATAAVSMVLAVMTLRIVALDVIRHMAAAILDRLLPTYKRPPLLSILPELQLLPFHQQPHFRLQEG